MFARSHQAIVLALASIVTVAGLSPAAFAAPQLDGNSKWWIEVVRERELPTALLESRRKEAAERAVAEKEAAEKAAAEKAAAEKAAAEKAEAEKAAAEKAAAETAEAEKKDPEKKEPEKGAAEKAAAEAGPGAGIRARVKGLLEALPEDKPDAEAPGDEEGAVPAEGAEADPFGDEDAAEPELAPKPPAKAAAAVKGPKIEPADAPADAADEKAPEKADPEAVAEAAEAEIGKLSITIAMAGDVIGLDNEHLRFRPVLQPDTELLLPLSQVASLSRHAPGKEPEHQDPENLEFRVVLRDGSEVPGQLMSLTDVAITVALVGSGAKIDLPIGEITRVERNNPVNNAALGPLPDLPDRHLAALSTGEVLAGQLLPSRDSDKWLRISSPILTAECPLSLIDLLIFPDPKAQMRSGAEEALADDVVEEKDDGNNAVAEEKKEDKPEDATQAPAELIEEPEEPDARHLVSLSPAGMIWAKKLELRGTDLMVSALGQNAFAVPMDRVESVSFGHKGLPTSAPVLVWGGFSDEDDEYKKTLDALDDRIPVRKLLQNKSKVPDADFKRSLRRARVLLVPEMESFRKKDLDAAMGKEGKAGDSWRDTFRGFLRRGGHIVFLSPTGEALNFFNEAGLGPLRSGGSGGSWEFTAEGKKLGVKVDGAVANVNATHYYRKSEAWQTWGQAVGGGDGVVVMGRRMDRGWVMVMGTDFYETNKNVTETLVKLLEFSGRR